MFRLIRFLFMTVLILASSLYVFLLFVDLNHFRTPIENELGLLLNRRVKVESINLKMSLTPSLAVKGVHIYNTEEFNEKATFARIGEMGLSFAIVPLFKGKIQLDDISIKNGSVFLIERENKNNWTLSSPTETRDSIQSIAREKVKSSRDFSKYHLNYIALKDISITYVNENKEENLVIKNATFTQMKSFYSYITYNNMPVQITLASDTLVPSLLTDRLNDFAFNLNLRGGDIKVAGSIGSLSSLSDIDLRVEGAVENFDEFLRSISFGRKLPEISRKDGKFSFSVLGGFSDLNIKEFKANFTDLGYLDFAISAQNISTKPKVSLVGEMELKSADLYKRYGLQPISVNFNSVYDNGLISLNKISTFINKTDIQLNGTIDLRSNVPFVKGNIYSEYFNFEDVVVQDELVIAPVKNNQPPVDKKSKSLNFSVLKMINADVKAKFENLKLFDNAYHKADVHIDLKDGNLTASPFSLDLLSGDIIGKMKIQAVNSLPEVDLYLKGVGLMISDLSFVKPYLKDSPANAVVELKTKGNTTDEMIDNLNGVVQLQIPSGVIVNKWFNSLPSVIGAVSKNSAFSYSGDEYYSKLSCAALKLNIKNGVINSDKNIALETSLINLAVSGDIDLKKKYLSLSLIPSINQANNKLNKKLSFAQYVKLQGPFSKIEMKEDVKGVLKDVANDKLTDLAQKALGVESKNEQVIPVGGLCQQALGLEVEQPVEVKKEETLNNQMSASKNNSLKDVKNSLKDQVKTQLEKSLTNILKKK